MLELDKAASGGRCTNLQTSHGGGSAQWQVDGTGCSGRIHGEEGHTTASARKSGSLGKVMLNCSSKDE